MVHDAVKRTDGTDPHVLNAASQEWIRQNLDEEDGTPYYHNRGVWNQIVVEIVSVYDGAGNIRREFDGWRTLIKAFADKEIGPSTLKRVAAIFD